jgi:uncharacterized membrane protein
MEQALIALSMWLHALATVVMIGYFLLAALIFVPILGRTELEGPGRGIISEISRRSRRWMYLALVLFFITGFYLMLVDPNYRGIGDFGNLWAAVMLVKHLLVLAMLGMGFWYNAIRRVGPMLRSNTGAEEAVTRFRTYTYSMAACGCLILLLTALAQVE